MSDKVWARKIAKATAAPEFQEWLGQMDAELEAFFQEDVPDGFPHSDPYNIEALTVVAEHLLEQFPTWKSYWENPDIAQYRDRLLRYYGTAWIELFEGTWINVPAAEARTRKWQMGAAVRLPFFPLYTFPHDDVNTVLFERDPTVFSDIYKYKTKRYTKWVTEGRAPGN